MTLAARKLLEQCLALPDEERRYLADELLASIQERTPDWEAAWAEEAARRSRAADSAGNGGRPWADVKADLVAKLSPR